MTFSMVYIEDTLIIEEGLKRLTWAHEVAGTPSSRDVRDWTVGGLWPGRSLQARLQRLIGTGQRTLVLLELDSPEVTLPRDAVPIVPSGVRATVDEEADVVTLTVPVLDWLPPAMRQRGLTFAEQTRLRCQASKLLLSPLLLEEHLIGTDVPLRFAMRTGTGPIMINQLIPVVGQLYNSACDSRTGASSGVQHAVGWPGASQPRAPREPVMFS